MTEALRVSRLADGPVVVYEHQAFGTLRRLSSAVERVAFLTPAQALLDSLAGEAVPLLADPDRSKGARNLASRPSRGKPRRGRGSPRCTGTSPRQAPSANEGTMAGAVAARRFTAQR
jgi:hypothetical protein